MVLFERSRLYIDSLIKCLCNSTFDSILRLVNFFPTIAGFSVRREKLFVPFWMTHLMLLLYVYGAGNMAYLMQHAQVAEDYIKCFVNVSLFVLVANISWWWLKKRQLLLETLKLAEQNDIDARSSTSFQKRHIGLLRMVKRIIVIFYVWNYTDATFVYLPNRVRINNQYAMTPCVGLEPLTSSPNKEVCLAILFSQELTIMITVLNYQALMLFLISHTSTMYLLLADEIMCCNSFSNLDETKEYAKKKLAGLIRRHIAVLTISGKLKSLYSKPLGIDFASNAVILSLLLYLPLVEWPKFSPILIYCFLVFFLYCFLCQRLTDASKSFETAVYSCGWEKFDQSEKKMVLVMLILAQKPVIMLAADIIPVNMYTFASTLQVMYKFVTVVKI